MNYLNIRKQLISNCQRYITHNLSQLESFRSFPGFEIYDNLSFMRAMGLNSDRRGFYGWIAIQYASIYDNILKLDNDSPSKDYTELYPPCQHKFTFFPSGIMNIHPSIDGDYYTARGYVCPSVMLDRLEVLIGLLNYVMITENKFPKFEDQWTEYQLKHGYDFTFEETAPPSVKIYQSILHLKALTAFVASLPTVAESSSFLAGKMYRALPLLIGYAKGIAVQELMAPLEDERLNDEEAVHAMASQLHNKSFLTVLAFNKEAPLENVLKILAVSLIAVGIGIIPTAYLAAKRLYDTGGTSMNFFKPLTQNLSDNLEELTAQVDKKIP